MFPENFEKYEASFGQENTLFFLRQKSYVDSGEQ